MKPTPKLSSEERRAAIIKAVRRVFAEKGFHGTTTRELAEAAGVSEALLFKHFPTKDALYSAMQLSWCSEHAHKAERFKGLEPSASTLVFLVHILVSKIVNAPTAAGDEETLQSRLLLRSLTEDGEFARLFLRGMPTQMMRKIEECLKAALAAGEASDGHVRPLVGAWFGQHLAAMLKIYLQPAEPVIDYGLSREKLVEQAVWFILRGLGLKEEAIQRYYNPKALGLFAC
jgi:AcrR family transcriptional regulator